MTVKQLRQELEKFPDDHMVILQKDSEGNGYSPAAGAEIAYYEQENDWSGTCIHPDDVEDHDVTECVVVYPIN